MHVKRMLRKVCNLRIKTGQFLKKEGNVRKVRKSKESYLICEIFMRFRQRVW